MMSGIYLRAKGLTVPVWYARQFTKWGAPIVMVLLLTGYLQLNTGFTIEEERKIIAKY